METSTYSQAKTGILMSAQQEHQCIAAHFELTRVCNLGCAHCLTGCSPSHEKAMGTSDWLRATRMVSELGVLWLTISGGESLCHPGLLDICSCARQQGILPTVFTNATLVDRAIARELATRGVIAAEVGFYGASRETYERVTGRGEFFDHAIRGIDLLLENGVPTRLKTLATVQTIHEIDDMRAIADKRGLPFLCEPIVMADRNERADAIRALRISPRATAELLWRKGASPTLPRPELYDCTHECGGGLWSLVINWSGRVAPCALLSELSDVQVQSIDSLADVWLSGFGGFRACHMPRCKERSSCLYAAHCPACPAHAYREGLSPDEPVPYICEVAKELTALYADSAETQPHSASSGRLP